MSGGSRSSWGRYDRHGRRTSQQRVSRVPPRSFLEQFNKNLVVQHGPVTTFIVGYDPANLGTFPTDIARAVVDAEYMRITRSSMQM